MTPKWVKDIVRWLAEKLSNWPSNSVTKPGIAGYLFGKKPFLFLFEFFRLFRIVLL